MLGQPRLPLMVAAFLVFVAGTFVGRYRCRLLLRNLGLHKSCHVSQFAWRVAPHGSSEFDSIFQAPGWDDTAEVTVLETRTGNCFHYSAATTCR